MRNALSVAAAFVLATVPVLATIPVAARADTSGSGQIVCEQEVRQLSQRLQDQSARMSPDQIRQISRRLQLANSECPQGLNYVSPQLSELSQQLGATPGPQTAQTPEDSTAPPAEGGR